MAKAHLGLCVYEASEIRTNEETEERGALCKCGIPLLEFHSSLSLLMRCPKIRTCFSGGTGTPRINPAFPKYAKQRIFKEVPPRERENNFSAVSKVSLSPFHCSVISGSCSKELNSKKKPTNTHTHRLPQVVADDDDDTERESLRPQPPPQLGERQRDEFIRPLSDNADRELSSPSSRILLKYTPRRKALNSECFLN